MCYMAAVDETETKTQFSTMKKERIFVKKYCCLLLVLIMVCLFSSCRYPYQDLEMQYHLPSKNTTSSSAQVDKATIPEVDNETPYQGLLTDEIDIHTFMEKYCFHAPYGSGSIEKIANDIGIQCLRETESGALYSIHKVKQGGLLYIFYMNRLEEALDHHPIIRCIYMQKNCPQKTLPLLKKALQ